LNIGKPDEISRRAAATLLAASMTPPLLVVLASRRWGFVYQRARQLVSRLAGDWRVFFVEEPMPCTGAAWLEEQLVDKELAVLVPHAPIAAPGRLGTKVPEWHALLINYLRRGELRVDVALIDSPSAQPLLSALKPSCVIYDRTNDPSMAGQDGRELLKQREAALLARASLVLTASPSLYDALQGRHPRVVCVPSAVDAAHYAADGLRMDSAHALQAQALQKHIPRPRLGYFGVIDERLDLDLLAELADARPQWQLVIVGPVCGIDLDHLHRRLNIHWLGMQPYARLPYLLNGWDLALIPFRLNEAARVIHPAQILEYMAGGKPVVSTPLHDVAWMYSDAVAIAPRGLPFVEACEDLLAEGPAARARRLQQMLCIVSTNCWDRTALAVHKLLRQALIEARDVQLNRAATAAAPLRSEATGDAPLG
jgi:UDP-galactopyranose mutase